MVAVTCNDSFSMCHIATLMYGLGLEASGLNLGLGTCGFGLGLGKGLVYITGTIGGACLISRAAYGLHLKCKFRIVTCNRQGH